MSVPPNPHLSSRMESIIAALDLASRANAPTEIDDPACVTPFHSSVPPPVTLVKYAERIAIYSGYGETGLALGLALIVRFVDLRTVPLNILTVHRILLTAVTVAGKAHMDFFVNNKYMSLVGGIPLMELNALEAWFLAGLAFEAIPTSREVARMITELVECVTTVYHVDPTVADSTNPELCRLVYDRLVLIGREEKASRRRRAEAVIEQPIPDATPAP